MNPKTSDASPAQASRYGVVSRRAALGGALGAALFALAACSNDDAGLAGAAPRDGTSTPLGTPTADSSASPSASSPSSSSGSASPAAADALPASATLAVSFTLAAAASGGPVRNPYVAVWIENEAGALVKTVALWHEDRGGQDRWLSEMKAFSALDATDAQTVSSATRQAGAYTVQWDGSTVDGARAAAGTYRLFIEAAREHGPYELVQQDLELGSAAASFDLTPNGEITRAKARYAV